MNGPVYPVQRRRTLAVAAISAVLGLVAAESSWTTIGILSMGGIIPAQGDDWWVFFDGASGLLAMAQVFALLVAAILFIAWQRNMTRNLERLDDLWLDPGVGWTTWSWFVPIANLFYPCRSMLQIAERSRPPEGERSRGLIAIWWTCWLLTGFLAQGGLLIQNSAPRPRVWIAGAGLGMVSNAVMILSGLMVLRLTMRLTRHQQLSLKLAAETDEAAQ